MLLLKYLPELAAVLIFIMMSTQLPGIGPFLVLGELALVALLFVFRPAVFIETLLRWWPLLLAPILAVVSALWSEVPALSARYGAQFLFTAFLGVLLARLMTPRRFVWMFFIAMFIFCVLSVLSGRDGPSAEGRVLIGLTGSKNQIGLAGQVLLLSALAVLMMRQAAAPLRWLAVLAIPLALFLVVGARSATATVMTLAGVAALFGLWFAQRLPPGGRVAAIVSAVLVLAPLSALTPELIQAVDHFVYDTLGKDPTLTGRTLLWARADDLIARRPFFGYGYQAIWMGESFDSIGLMRLTGMDDGRQFHFHHQFRQTAVDTGVIGLVALAGSIIAAGLAALRQFLLYPSVATSFFLITFLLTVARGFGDVVLTPFSMHAVLFFAAAVYAFWRPQQIAATAGSASLSRLRRAPA
jgi:exopolysaccharide production protein ExoQ